MSSSVFLNIPYDREYQDLYLALIAGCCALHLNPRATLEIASGERRLERIYRMMTGCRYSIHDLSRVDVNTSPPTTPRFNMPFELGLLLGWKMSRQRKHDWFVLEAVEYRLNKSLSDLNGTDPLIHGGTPEGVFKALRNAFSTKRPHPTVEDIREIYRRLRGDLPDVMKHAGAAGPFEASVFRDLTVLAASYARHTGLAVR